MLLQFEAIRAYQEAVRATPASRHRQLASLMADHEEAARELVALMRQAGLKPPGSSQVQGFLAAEVAGLLSEPDMWQRLARLEEQVAAACAGAARSLAAEPGATEFLNRLVARGKDAATRLTESQESKG